MPETVDWRLDRRAAIVLNALAVPLLAVGVVGFTGLAVRHLPASGRTSLAAPGVVLFLLVTAALTVILFVAHEAVHGLIMAAFGARPRFGALMIAGVAPALYTTAPGHLFSRRQYMAVALTPAVAISALGVLACSTAAGIVAVVPFAIHLSGCVGDFAAALRLLREPRGTLCEDMREGIRFHRPDVGP